MACTEVRSERLWDIEAAGNDLPQGFTQHADLLHDWEFGVDQDHVTAPDLANAAFSGHPELERLHSHCDPEVFSELMERCPR